MWKLAWRNLWRNRTRTVILLTAVGLPYAMMIVSFGFIGDFLRKMEERSAETVGGTVLVHGEGYWNARSNDIVIDDAERVRESVAAAEEVRAAIPRVLVSGMLSSSRGAKGVQLRGIDPERQAKLRDLSPYVVEGAFLSEDDERPIVLGAGLVETLEVELGDKVVLTASDRDGEVARFLFRLRGVVETGSPKLDDAAAFTRLGVAQEALGLEDGVHQIGVVSTAGVESGEVAASVRGAVDGGGADLEVLTWQEAMPEMVSYLSIERAGMNMMLIIVFVIVSFVIANTFLMSVMERVREFGLFSALGLDDRRIAQMVFLETAVLTGIAIGIGLVLGLAGHFALDVYGIDIAELFGAEMQLSGIALEGMVMRSAFVPGRWLLGTAGVVALVFLAAAYPAWKATRLAPSKAMEFYEQ